VGGWTSLLVVGAKPDFALVGEYCERHRDDAEVCGGSLRHELAVVKPTKDPRVKAAFVMAPFAIPFGDESAFTEVTAPIFLSWGEADQLLLPPDNAEHVLRAPTLRGKHRYPGAGHYAFIPPCSPQMASRIAQICKDPPGFDRAAMHAQIIKDAIVFFDETLR
jgi:predicted dienelactone hydrolase